MAKGLFITFEGIEGSGKTTQVQMLGLRLRREGFTVVLTREPGGTPIGEKIRHLLLDPSNREMLPFTELLLYIASRAQHYGELILPALNRGEIVISDRFLDASVAYQGAGRNLPIEWINTLNNMALKGDKPNFTFIIDVDLEESRRRLLGRDLFPDRLEQEESDFFNPIRQNYLALTKSEEERFKLINGLGRIEDIHETIC